MAIYHREYQCKTSLYMARYNIITIIINTRVCIYNANIIYRYRYRYRYPRSTYCVSLLDLPCFVTCGIVHLSLAYSIRVHTHTHIYICIYIYIIHHLPSGDERVLSPAGPVISTSPEVQNFVGPSFYLSRFLTQGIHLYALSPEGYLLWVLPWHLRLYFPQGVKISPRWYLCHLGEILHPGEIGTRAEWPRVLVLCCYLAAYPSICIGVDCKVENVMSGSSSFSVEGSWESFMVFPIWCNFGPMQRCNWLVNQWPSRLGPPGFCDFWIKVESCESHILVKYWPECVSEPLSFACRSMLWLWNRDASVFESNFDCSETLMIEAALMYLATLVSEENLVRRNHHVDRLSIWYARHGPPVGKSILFAEQLSDGIFYY